MAAGTRLDRLFLLLDTGSTPVIRKTAAEQLGEVQKLHPHEFHNLLTKVHAFLGSSTWETRIAASQAVEAIARNVPKWSPTGTCKDEGSSSSPTNVGRLLFSQFDIRNVLLHGASLLASTGGEFDVSEDLLNLDAKERLAQQKQQLNKRLGLDVAVNLGIATDLFKEEDLLQNDSTHTTAETQSSVADLVRQQMAVSTSQMSARERNRAKRKAKLLAKQVSHDPEKKASNGDGSDSEPSCKMRKTSSVVLETTDGQDNKIVLDNVPDNTMNMDDMDEWPFEAFCELLMNDLFHTTWERRHGAASGLREVLKLHGSGAGKTTDTPSDKMETENEHWLEDLSLRIICVLALDRFGDFIADEVVAPVRETCAQTLGVALQHMSAVGVKSVLAVLLELLQQHQWEVRHGGLLGIKYALAVRQDVCSELLPQVLPAVFHGLQDMDDDVRAVAAAALLPVTDNLIHNEYVSSIVQCLWQTLLDLDDLTASTNSIMSLLSSLLSQPHITAERLSQQSLTELVPRLWPFMRHNIASVRREALNTLYTLLTKQQCQTHCEWMVPILQDALRHVFQRALLEDRADILELVQKAWKALTKSVPAEVLVAAASPWLGHWMCLMMQPPHLPFDPTRIIEAKHKQKEQSPSKRPQVEPQQLETKDYIGGTLSQSNSAVQRDRCVTRARRIAARLLGLLCSYYSLAQDMVLPPGADCPTEAVGKLFLFYLASKSALQRFAVAHVILEWARLQQPCTCPSAVRTRLVQCLIEPIYFDEIAMSFAKMQAECCNLLASLKQQGIDLDNTLPSGGGVTLEQAQALTGDVFESVRSRLKPKQQNVLEERRHQLAQLVNQTNLEQQVLSTRVQSGIAAALVILQDLPEKFNPIIRPFMDALKKEQNAELQEVTAQCMASLLHQSLSRAPCPNPKVIKNLCTSLCCHPVYTPVISSLTPGGASLVTDTSMEETPCDKHSGILTLYAQQKAAGMERMGPGRRPSHMKRSRSFCMTSALAVDVTPEMIATEEDETKRQLLIQRRGATVALTTITANAGKDLPETMNSLWQTITEKLKKIKSTGLEKESGTEGDAQELVYSLQVQETICTALHTNLHSPILGHLDALCLCLEHPYTAVRHMAARALAAVCKVATAPTMNKVMETVVPLLGATDTDPKRQGAIEAVANLIDQLGLDVVPYVVLLVVPVLGCMSDQNTAVRLMATHCFSALIRIIPLEAGMPDPPMMSAELVARKEHERHFLEQLLDGSKLDSYTIPVPIQAELRKYQQDGVNWLWFLNKYKLHGILCDDMGLGKTLQSICILAGDHFTRMKRFKESSDADVTPLPSIVVCPPTLTGHWIYEVKKFVTSDLLNPLHYTGPPAERQRLQKRVKKHNLVVASYDVVRNDIEFFSSLKWDYCILDEGHIIKNSKTKLSKAVKQLTCNHRLILSGTPIQNNVLELWSLFDFLMPGFLGTEKQFQARYGRPILQSRDAKSSSKEQEAGALAMEGLHRQVLPFILRRLKEDVLQDLPPKIIQDYYCDLSPLQVQLYEDFAKSRAKKSLDDDLTEVQAQMEKLTTNRSHIFQALQYLRKVCNHPGLVLTAQHPQYDSIIASLQRNSSSIQDLVHAPKLTALKQLLNDCGIGLTSTEAMDMPVVNQHRVLLFCQLKAMLDIVENDLLKAHLPSVTYLRLDGSVPAGMRHTIVNRFNNDPSIDVLLLTTHVGGLGLNLTGADTVIFVEHDWNPMKDLQAMDRAHRIGQKKVVNVYRLVTQGTLEEKIMGLQKFKMNIANTVINQENASMASMGTDQLLDLFCLDQGNMHSQSSNQEDKQSGKQGMKAILENLQELWDEKQYETEYDMGTFLKSLSK